MKKQANYNGYKVVVEINNSITATLNGELCKNSKKALREISNEVGFTYQDKWNTQQFGSKLVDFLNMQKSQGSTTKKVTLKFYGLEYEWEGLKKDGENEWCSGLYCDSIHEIGLYVDDEELTDKEALKHLDRTTEQRTTLSNDWKDVVGLCEWYNKACYTYEIEVQDTFDPMKLNLNVVECEFVVKDDVLVADEVILLNITYDGKEYECDDIDATGKGSELVWGYDPEDEDEFGEVDDWDDEDEENEGEDEDSCESEEESVEASLRNEYDEVYKGDGIFFIDKDGKCGIADEEGNVIIPVRYDWIHDEMDMDDGVILAGIGDKTYYVCSGGFEIDVSEYDRWGHFKYGRTTIGVFNGKDGMIDKTGKIVVPIIYDEIYNWFEDGTIKVKLDGEEFLVDAEGNRIEEK